MLRFLIEKEFKQIIRNAFLPRMLVMMPLVMMLVFPWAANQEIRELRLSVVDNDHSTSSERLVRKAIASGYFRLADLSATGDRALHSVEAGDADLILEIENDFERNLIQENVAQVMISANAINGTKGGLSASYLSSVVGDYAAELRESSGSNGAVSVPHFGIATQYKFNPHLDYKVFMVPALMVMLLTMLCGFLPALNIVAEKESGTIEQMNVTPVNRLLFIFAKLVPYWLIGFLVLSICLGLAALLYGIYPVGSLLTVYLFASIYVLVVSGFGLVISNYSETMQQAMFVMYFFIMILLLMSGMFTPIASMPTWAQHLTLVNPLRYFIDVMRLVYLKGSAFGELKMQFYLLAGFALVLNAWAIGSYRKSR